MGHASDEQAHGLETPALLDTFFELGLAFFGEPTAGHVIENDATKRFALVACKPVHAGFGPQSAAVFTREPERSRGPVSLYGELAKLLARKKPIMPEQVQSRHVLSDDLAGGIARELRRRCAHREDYAAAIEHGDDAGHLEQELFTPERVTAGVGERPAQTVQGDPHEDGRHRERTGENPEQGLGGGSPQRRRQKTRRIQRSSDDLDR